MTHIKSLNDIYHDDIQNLVENLNDKNVQKHYNNFYNEKLDDKKNKNIRTSLAFLYRHKNLLDEEDVSLLDEPGYSLIMYQHSFKEGIVILKENKEKKESAALNLKDEISTSIEWRSDEHKLSEHLLNLESQFGKEWLIQQLLSLNPEDVNIDDDLGYIDSLPVLKYIGKTEDFTNHFLRWYEEYHSWDIRTDDDFYNNFSFMKDIYPRQRDEDLPELENSIHRKHYLRAITNYIPYIPGIMDLYSQINNLQFEDYDLVNNFEKNIKIPIEKFIYPNTDKYYIKELEDIDSKIQKERKERIAEIKEEEKEEEEEEEEEEEKEKEKEKEKK